MDPAGGTIAGCGAFYIDGERHDIGAACDLPCPGDFCRITVTDDVNPDRIFFRICIVEPGPRRCPLAERGWGTGFSDADIIDVLPVWDQATRGTVTTEPWEG